MEYKANSSSIRALKSALHNNKINYWLIDAVMLDMQANDPIRFERVGDNLWNEQEARIDWYLDHKDLLGRLQDHMDAVSKGSRFYCPIAV